MCDKRVYVEVISPINLMDISNGFEECAVQPGKYEVKKRENPFDPTGRKKSACFPWWVINHTQLGLPIGGWRTLRFHGNIEIMFNK